MLKTIIQMTTLTQLQWHMWLSAWLPIGRLKLNSKLNFTSMVERRPCAALKAAWQRLREPFAELEHHGQLHARLLERQFRASTEDAKEAAYQLA